MVVTCFHIQGRDLFLEANRRGGCWVETEDEEESTRGLFKSGKAHRSPGPASLCLPAAITLTCGQPLGAMHVILEVWAPLLHVLLVEAEVYCFLPGQHIRYCLCLPSPLSPSSDVMLMPVTS